LCREGVGLSAHLIKSRKEGVQLGGGGEIGQATRVGEYATRVKLGGVAQG